MFGEASELRGGAAADLQRRDGEAFSRSGMAAIARLRCVVGGIGRSDPARVDPQTAHTVLEHGFGQRADQGLSGEHDGLVARFEAGSDPAPGVAGLAARAEVVAVLALFLGREVLVEVAPRQRAKLDVDGPPHVLGLGVALAVAPLERDLVPDLETREPDRQPSNRARSPRATSARREQGHRHSRLGPGYPSVHRGP
jgi:hypothetical protein